MVTTQDDTRTGPGTGTAVLAFVAFVVFSALVVFQDRHAGGSAAERTEAGEIESGDSHLETAAMFGNSTVRSRSRAFRDADSATVFGRSEIDLTAAQLAGGRGTIDLFVMFGEAEVRVPSDWTVVTKSLVTLGSVENRARGAETESGRTLDVEGLVLFGSLRILRGQ